MKKAVKNLRGTFFSAVLCFVVSTAYPATFSVPSNGSSGVMVSGRIEKGDTNKLMRFLLDNLDSDRIHSKIIYLNSPGGDVNEAFEMADFLERSLRTTAVVRKSECLSACTVLWAAGANRIVDETSRLGFHRVRFQKEKSSMEDYQKQITPVADRLYNHLQQRGIPRVILDKMMETPATDMFYVTSRWLYMNNLSRAIAYNPWFLDAVETKCGREPIIEGRAFTDWIDCMYSFMDEDNRRATGRFWHGYQKK